MPRLTAYIMLLLLTALPSQAAAERPVPETCTYETATWNVNLGRSVDHRTIRHPYSELLPVEMDEASGCTVCREDQELVEIPGLEPVYLCHRIAWEVEAALMELVEAGEHIVSLRGYTVIMSRGPINDEGNRTQFSNHSFGAALDINREINGLYKDCFQWGPKCKLALGGPWRPGTPGTLVRGGPIVSAMEAIGLKWGGEIAGRQKDFMHFSLSGY